MPLRRDQYEILQQDLRAWDDIPALLRTLNDDGGGDDGVETTADAVAGGSGLRVAVGGAGAAARSGSGFGATGRAAIPVEIQRTEPVDAPMFTVCVADRHGGRSDPDPPQDDGAAVAGDGGSGGGGGGGGGSVDDLDRSAEACLILPVGSASADTEAAASGCHESRVTFDTLANILQQLQQVRMDWLCQFFFFFVFTRVVWALRVARGASPPPE